MAERLIKILLVDDDDNDNFFHKRAIDKAGLNTVVDVCTTGLDALDYLQNKGEYESEGAPLPQPDLIFLDINMPKLNGWDFLEAYEELPLAPEVKTSEIIVMLSNSSSDTDKERALSSPSVKAYMEKPLQPEGLLSVIE